MTDKIREELESRILDIFTKLNDDNLDEKERERLSEELNRLYRLKLEEDKGDIEWEKVRKENETSDIQLEESRIDRWVKIGIAGAELLVPLAFYGIWLWTGFKFEETGTYTSPTFKHLIKFFKPKK